jgi:dimethylglycine catabolism A
VKIPVIAVGRLGDPDTARLAVETGKADFISLGRSLVADPEWVAKLRRGEPRRACLACNTCVNEMRGGAGMACVVNGAAGRERHFEEGKRPTAERIAVVGAGPAGLTYASLVATGNHVVLFEREQHAGGAFRYAGKAPLFQEVEANPASFERYIDLMVRACELCGVTIRYGVDVADQPSVLNDFDRIIIATGARYRHGLAPLVKMTLDTGIAHWPGIRQLASANAFRNWFYYDAREGTGAALMQRLGARSNMIAIGDAVKAGKSKEAIGSAFEAAIRSC